MDSATTDSNQPSSPAADAGSGSKLRAVAAAFGVAVFGFVLAVPVGFVVANAYVALTGNEIDSVALLGISLVSLQGLAFPITAWLYLRYTDRPWSFIPASVPSLDDLKYVVASYIGIFAVIYAIAIVLTVTSTEAASNSAATTALEHPEIIPYLAILQLLLVGPGEELLFRGVVQGSLREYFSAPVAILLASMTFAPAHITALAGGLQAVAVSVGVLFVPSLFFGFLYEKTENIVAAALAHGLYNATLFAIMYAAVQTGAEPEMLLL